ncbi:hypothetical protein BCEN4_740033 [Burkholderia cenocepacia]|nr:hypothetical protein BCEN4_740033 [Burkholderia cenocepacia]
MCLRLLSGRFNHVTERGLRFCLPWKLGIKSLSKLYFSNCIQQPINISFGFCIKFFFFPPKHLA